MEAAPSNWEIIKMLLLVFGLYAVLPAVLMLLNWIYLPVSDGWHWIITMAIVVVEGICVYVANPFKRV